VSGQRRLTAGFNRRAFSARLSGAGLSPVGTCGASPGLLSAGRVWCKSCHASIRARPTLALLAFAFRRTHVLGDFAQMLRQLTKLQGYLEIVRLPRHARALVRQIAEVLGIKHELTAISCHPPSLTIFLDGSERPTIRRANASTSASVARRAIRVTSRPSVPTPCPGPPAQPDVIRVGVPHDQGNRWRSIPGVPRPEVFRDGDIALRMPDVITGSRLFDAGPPPVGHRAGLMRIETIRTMMHIAVPWIEPRRVAGSSGSSGSE